MLPCHHARPIHPLPNPVDADFVDPWPSKIRAGSSAPAQRLGLGVPGSQDLWIHAASVGEARAIAPLAQAWAQQYRVLVTTTTPTGAEQIRQLAPDCSHAFLPYDLPWAMRHWHQCIRPKALVLVETELWPNLIHQARCPVFLVNGRMSAKSESGYQRFASLTRPMLKKVQVLAQTTDHAKAFGRLGAADVQVMGNLKYDLEPLPEDPVEKARTGLGDGPGLWRPAPMPAKRRRCWKPVRTCRLGFCWCRVTPAV